MHPGERSDQISLPLTAPMLTSLDPGRIRASGCNAVTISHPVSLGEDAEFDIRFIRFLREALSFLLTVEWSLATPGPVDIGGICHLPPPSAPASGYADRWRGRYGFGHCYYRRGPGFVHVVDVRDPDDAARFLLDEPTAVEAFGLLAGAVRLHDVPPLAAELAAQLADAGLLFQLGGWATLLPHRLERWPLPCTAV